MTKQKADAVAVREQGWPPQLKLNLLPPGLMGWAGECWRIKSLFDQTGSIPGEEMSSLESNFSEADREN